MVLDVTKESSQGRWWAICLFSRAESWELVSAAQDVLQHSRNIDPLPTTRSALGGEAMNTTLLFRHTSSSALHGWDTSLSRLHRSVVLHSLPISFYSTQLRFSLRPFGSYRLKFFFQLFMLLFIQQIFDTIMGSQSLWHQVAFDHFMHIVRAFYVLIKISIWGQTGTYGWRITIQTDSKYEGSGFFSE